MILDNRQPLMGGVFMLNYHIVVTGRVQGVGFRWSTHELALQHGLVGQVKNEWDGSVTIDVQGPAKAVKMFVKEVQAGPNPICQSHWHADRATRHSKRLAGL
jgi:acylphosphatase